jgi:hypothetical protein
VGLGAEISCNQPGKRRSGTGSRNQLQPAREEEEWDWEQKSAPNSQVRGGVGIERAQLQPARYKRRRGVGAEISSKQPGKRRSGTGSRNQLQTAR